MGFICLKTAELLLGDSLLFTTKLPGVLHNLLIDLGKVKAELILEPPSGLEPETPGLGIRRPNTTLKYNTFSACKLTMLVLGSSK